MSRCVPRRLRRQPPAGSPAPTRERCRHQPSTSWRHWTGSQRADGNITNQGTYIIGRDGKVVGSGGGAPGIGGNFSDAPAADGSTIVTVLPGGAAPDGPNQVVIDEKSAATAGFQIGDTVQLVTTGAQPAVTGDHGRHGPVRRDRQSDRCHPGVVRHPDGATALPRRRRRLQRHRGHRRRQPVEFGAARRDRGDLAGGPGSGGRRRVRRREPGPAGAGAVVHHHVPAGVRRRCAGGRHAS